MNLIKFNPDWPDPTPLADAVAEAPLRLSRGVPLIIAEDDPVSMSLLVSTLRIAGYDPIVTTNGSEAMAALRLQDRACLAIVDWMMPEVDGAEVCRRVRESGKLVHVIMLTARDRKADIIEALDAGADDYLIKPFDRGEMLARVRAGIRNLDAQSALRDRAHESEQSALRAPSTKLSIPI